MRRAKAAHWEFARRFRRGAFGWKSQPAIQRVRQAVSEIKTAARRDPILGAEGAVLFLERVSPALEHVDSSSGAIGTAVNHAVEELGPLIGRAPVDAKKRESWLERLWEAHGNDAIPYIERLGDFRGELCVTAETASAWADRHGEGARVVREGDPAREPGAVRPEDVDASRAGLRRPAACVRRRGGTGRAPLACRGRWLRDHGCRRLGRLREHDEGGRGRRARRGGSGSDPNARGERDVWRTLRHPGSSVANWVSDVSRPAPLMQRKG
jgi:hypothetical protein